MADEYKQWEKLTTMEKLYIATNPHHAFAIRDSKKKAFSETSKKFGFNGHNDESDAFRHCFWSAIISREMDLHNNYVGLSIGKQFFHFAPGIGELFESDGKLSNMCYKAYTEGKLRVALSKSIKKPKY